MRGRSYNCWFVVQRATVRGEWAAHCLELDAVSQGTSLLHALEMLTEACAMIIGEDLAAGRDPLDRRAPKPYWDELYALVRQGRAVDVTRIDETKVGAIAGQVTFLATRQTDGRARSRRKPQVPLAWTQPGPLQACSHPR